MSEIAARAVPHCQNGLSVEFVGDMDAKSVENSQNVKVVGLVYVKIACIHVNSVIKPDVTIASRTECVKVLTVAKNTVKIALMGKIVTWLNVMIARKDFVPTVGTLIVAKIGKMLVWAASEVSLKS